MSWNPPSFSLISNTFPLLYEANKKVGNALRPDSIPRMIDTLLPIQKERLLSGLLHAIDTLTTVRSNLR